MLKRGGWIKLMSKNSNLKITQISYQIFTSYLINTWWTQNIAIWNKKIEEKIARWFSVVRPPAYVHDLSFPLRLLTNPLLVIQASSRPWWSSNQITPLEAFSSRTQANPSFRIFFSHSQMYDINWSLG